MVTGERKRGKDKGGGGGRERGRQREWGGGRGRKRGRDWGGGEEREEERERRMGVALSFHLKSLHFQCKCLALISFRRSADKYSLLSFEIK